MSTNAPLTSCPLFIRHGLDLSIHPSSTPQIFPELGFDHATIWACIITGAVYLALTAVAAPLSDLVSACVLGGSEGFLWRSEVHLLGEGAPDIHWGCRIAHIIKSIYNAAPS